MIEAMLPAANSDKRKLWISRTLMRKAVASMQLDRLEEALVDYKKAAKIDPNDSKIKGDIERLEKAIKEKSVS